MYPVILGIDAYVFMSVLGFALAFGLGVLRRKTYGYEIRELVAMLCSIIVGLMIGGKILFTITEIPALINNNFSWEIVNERVLNGGFVFYGGVLGAIVSICILSRYMKADTRKMMNFVVPCFSFFHAFGRLGCFFQGCCYGIESSFGVCMAGESIKRFPVQLVEAISLLAITGILLLIESDSIKKNRNYEMLPIYLLIYAPVRFVLEMVRGDLLRGVTHVIVDYNTTDGNLNFAFDVSTSQIISIIIIAVVLLYELYRYLLAKKVKACTVTEEEAEAEAEESEDVTVDAVEDTEEPESDAVAEDDNTEEESAE